jgi:S-DNA-T family DNA segregation ATPase FtsK/SpoIIIE
MAAWQNGRRDPLIDRNVQAMLEKRGRELAGLILVGLASAAALMLGTYSVTDPGWMVDTTAPVANALGRPGAALASTLVVIGGQGAWGLPVLLAGWGLRFILHLGEDRALSRIVFAIIALAVGAVFAATHPPGPTWPHAFGLGGLFGDTVLGALLGVAPVEAGAWLKVVSVLAAAGTVAIWAYVLGFDMAEVKAIGRFLLVGLIVAYAGLLAALRGAGVLALRGAVQAARVAGAVGRAGAATVAARAGRSVDPALPAAPPAAATAHRRAPRIETDGPAYPAPEPLFTAAPRGLLACVPGLIRRAAEPATAERPAEPPADLGPEDRIRARISDVIRARIRGTPGSPVLSPAPPPPARAEPPISRLHRPAPLQGAPVPPADAAARTVAAAPTAPAVAVPAAAPAEARPAARQPDAPPLSGPAFADTEADEDDAADDNALAEAARAAAAAVRPVPRRVVQPAARPAPSARARAEAQPALRFGDDDDRPAYEPPPLSLLRPPPAVPRTQLSTESLEENARMLENVLDDYGVKGEIVSVRPGPVVTMYELEPAPGLKASRVIGLADDIARSMSALSARVSTVPGRSVIGIELPNATREKVYLREILAHRDFGDSEARLPLALGKDIAGAPVVANLARMPHLLIAGTTGSGKSVAINTMILSLLYKLSPEECRLIMIDPKMLELSVYDGIPHLLAPVVTDPKKAVVALKWVVSEMEERYRKMSRMGVRNIEGYNGRVREALAAGEMFRRTVQTGFDPETGDPVFETEEFEPKALPWIVVIVDEMADLMMVAGKEIEACIQRLAQMARASGIHLIMATQRPSVDVITGTIKANFPTRISFQVTSKIDSRTILGEQGAEQLLGQGDMLYMAGGSRITRIHGPFVSDEEVEEVVNHLKSFGPPAYMSGVVDGPDEEAAAEIDQVLGLASEASDDALYDQAVAIVAKDRKCSTSYIQRKLGIGYNKAARLVEQMEERGVVTRANHVGKREILVPEG